MIIRLYRRARRQLAYWHHLNTLVGRHTAAGYRVSPETYAAYQKQARRHADPPRAPRAWAPDPGPDDVTRFDLIRDHPYLFERW